jgi:hypothetical protein
VVALEQAKSESLVVLEREPLADLTEDVPPVA